MELTQFCVERGLTQGWDEERESWVVDLEALKGELAKLEGGVLVVDGHLSHLVAPPGSLVVVLRRAPWRLFQELTEREYPPEKVWENVEAEMVGVVLEEARQVKAVKVHEVDTTSITPQEAAQEVARVYRGETPPQARRVDWLTHPETLRLLVRRPCTLS